MRKQKLRIGRGRVTVGEWLPDGKPRGTVFIAPGWGETPKTFKRLALELSRRGYRVLTVGHLRRYHSSIKHGHALLAQGQKAQVLTEVWHKLGLQNFDVIAHSEAGINAVLAALVRPEPVRSLWLCNAAGFLSKDSYADLCRRFSRNIGHHLKGMVARRGSRRHHAAHLGRGLAYGLRSLRLTWREGTEIARARLVNEVVALRNQDTKVFTLVSRQDPIFPEERQVILEVGRHTDEVIIQDGSHDDLHIQPAGFAELVDHRLRKLDQQR